LRRFICGLLWTIFFSVVAFGLAGGIAGWRIREQNPNLLPEEAARLAVDSVLPWIPYCLGGAISLGIIGAGTGILPGTRIRAQNFNLGSALVDPLTGQPYSKISYPDQPISWPPLPEQSPGWQPQYGGSAGADLARVMGIVSMFAWCLPVLGLPVSIVGLVAGFLSLKTIHRQTAVSGIALCALGLVLSVINSVLGVMLFLSMKRHH
jgi:hypothetical protein